MKNLVIMKYDAFAVSLISIIFGCVLFIFPDLINYGEVYEVLSNIFNSYTFGAIFIVLSIMKVIGIFGNYPRLRAFSISGLISIWTLFFLCVAFSGVENSVWVFSLAMVIFSFGVVIKEWFH